MRNFVVVVGSVTPPGRLYESAKFATLAAQQLGTPKTSLLDMASLSLPFADGREPSDIGGDVERVFETLRDADAVLIATPTYRASYTGALKNLLDLMPIQALQAKPVGVLAMGATAHHYLGADWQLRSVLGWFGSLLAPTSIFLTSSDFSDGKPTAEAEREIDSLVATLSTLSDVSHNVSRPEPLAARKG